MSAASERAVYLVSSAGMPNYGDEVIARAWLDWLATHHPHVDVWLDCIEPGRAAHLFRDTHPRLRTTNTLWDLAHKGRSDDPLVDEPELRRIVRELGSPRIDAGVQFLRGVRSVHFLGGGYLNALWGRNLNMMSAASELKRAFGVEVYLTGQGFLPQSERTAPWLADLLQEFDFVESRDGDGASSLSVRTGIDDAFLAFANPRPMFRDEATPAAMILLQGDFIEAGADAQVLSAASEFVSRFAPSGDVGLIEALPPDDAVLLPALRDRFPRLRFYPFAEIWEHGLPACPRQAWLTSRFHPHLVAAAAGAAGTALRLHAGYYGIKHGSLQALGTGWHVADVAEDLTPQSDPGFPSRVPEFARTKAAVAAQLYPAIPVTGVRSGLLRLRGRKMVEHAVIV